MREKMYSTCKFSSVVKNLFLVHKPEQFKDTWKWPKLERDSALYLTACVLCFSRLQGSYEALKGGQTIEAMEDFTGGLGEDFDMKNVRKGEMDKKEIFHVIQKGLRRGDLMGCSITVSISKFFGRNVKTWDMLTKRHMSQLETYLAKQLIVNTSFFFSNDLSSI